ncbi:hypothetical protein PVT67_15985 [Gallaecimonas kandeliae]|uniref:hypothetical protein n=1 Tax=Gallaecimonas kandeliae TaxID=3029055 RepID=UPI002647B7BD|nr:hypothetical protein [Gallaecimonas kandeliae]WKE65143.1 hypothetical protein PVT67_15985 [Gallaecimonas kandeliae]
MKIKAKIALAAAGLGMGMSVAFTTLAADNCDSCWAQEEACVMSGLPGYKCEQILELCLQRNGCGLVK